MAGWTGTSIAEYLGINVLTVDLYELRTITTLVKKRRNEKVHGKGAAGSKERQPRQ